MLAVPLMAVMAPAPASAGSTVTITESITSTYRCGQGAEACENNLTVDGTDLASTSDEGEVTYGLTAVTVYGGSTTDSTYTEAKDNTVTFKYVSGTSVIGGYSSKGAVTGNNVTVANSSLSGYVYGRYATLASCDAGSNTVTITSSTVSGLVYGGYNFSSTAADNTAAASGNEVTITDSEAGSIVFAAYLR